jgi:hypothetical protein
MLVGRRGERANYVTSVQEKVHVQVSRGKFESKEIVICSGGDVSAGFADRRLPCDSDTAALHGVAGREEHV